MLGRPPDQIRDPIPTALLATLWRLHGRVAHAHGEQSRAIALHGRALKYAEAAHDSRGIGLAHFELVYCYLKVGDHAIVREHLTEAAAALHAAGDRRHLAQVHSVSGVMFAQQGRYDDATAALRNAERLATALGAEDVLALTCMNQAAVAQLRRRYDQAIALAERAVALHDHIGQPHRLAESLATLGQVYVKLGRLDPADEALQRALTIAPATRAPEITGAVYDTLAQIALMRGDYERAADALTRAADAYGAYGRQTSKWYEWSVRVIRARLSVRQGRADEALALADAIIAADGAPPGRAPRRRADRRRGAAARRTHRRGRGAASPPPKAASTRGSRPARGASSCACAASCTPARGGPTRRTTTSRRARASSTWSASATRRR